LGQQGQRLVIIHLLLIDNTAVPMAGVFAQANIGYDYKLRHFFLDNANGLLNYSVGIVTERTNLILVIRYTEQDDSRNLQVCHFLHCSRKIIR